MGTLASLPTSSALGTAGIAAALTPLHIYQIRRLGLLATCFRMLSIDNFESKLHCLQNLINERT